MSDKINKNNEEIKISRVTNLSESVMRDCYYVLAQTLPMDAEEFYCRAIGDVNRGGHILFVAETPRMVVGLIKGAATSNGAQIHCLAVDKKYRRHGIGESLVKAYENAVLNEYGAPCINVKSSSGALSFYRNRGYLGATQYLHKSFSR